MNFTSTFKPMVSAYMNRDATLLTAASGSIDLILAAANQAKALAQRKHRFNHAKTVAKITISSADGAALSSAKDLSNNSITVRNILAAGISVTGGVVPIDLLSRDAQHERAKRLMEGQSLEQLAQTQFLVSEKPQLVQLGTAVMLWPWPGTTDVILDIVQFLPDYAPSTNETDFFLAECSDWMLLQTCTQLNFFLKEDQRVVISDKLMEAAWATVTAWDLDFDNNPVTLD